MFLLLPVALSLKCFKNLYVDVKNKYILQISYD